MLTLIDLFSGGAIAISHPLGMSAFFDLVSVSHIFTNSHIAGVRQLVTGLAELKRTNKELLMTSMCVGSGMGAAGLFVNEQ
jgi:acetyl-CoA acyltransferase 1